MSNASFDILKISNLQTAILSSLSATTFPKVIVVPALQFRSSRGGAPVHVAAGFHFLKPGQAGLGGDHGVDGLADGLLVDLADIDLHAFGSADDQLALGLQLALDQGLVGIALAFGRLPGPAALFVGPTLPPGGQLYCYQQL